MKTLLTANKEMCMTRLTLVYRTLLVTILASVLSACGANPTRDASSELDVTNPTITPVTIDGVDDGSEIDPRSVAGRAPIERVILFDYDTAQLRSEYLDVVTQHGRFLAQNPEGRVRLEGHTDERGTREYNIGLGESRAKTIARMLQLQGVSSAQVRTISYGEEIPVDEGHNNGAWAKNRRVNIIYEVVAPPS